MWDEYGDGGRGICLGIDIKRNMLREVKYVSKMETGTFPNDLLEDLHKLRRKRNEPVGVRPSLTPFEKRGLECIEPLLLTKFDGWAYEKELRAFLLRNSEENVLYFAKFSSGIYLQEVIPGERCEVSEVEVRDLVKGYPRQPIRVKRVAL
jgi:hypothetical protein